MSRIIIALCLILLLPIGAAAQPVDASTGRTLQHTLQAWFAGLLGPGLGAPARRLQVTAAGDHFHVALPFADAAGDRHISADVRPLKDGRWSVDALRLPAVARFTVQMPQPDGPSGSTLPTSVAMRIGSQHNHAVVDPSLTGLSQLDIDLGNLALVTKNAHEYEEQHIDRYLVQVALRPRDGRPGGDLDLSQQATIIGWNSASRVGNHPATGFGADRIQASGSIDGIDRVNAAALLSAVGGLVATMPPTTAAASHGETVMSAPARAALRALIASLRGVITGLQGQETIDGLHVAIAGQGEATVREVRFDIAGTAPDGLLHATTAIALDGVAARNLPPQAMALMPHHVAVRASISGLSLTGLRTLALAATNPGVSHPELQTDAAALLAKGGATIGLDTLDMDVAGASVHGAGHVRLIGNGRYETHLRITATGLDDLMRQAESTPALQRALPFLAMARGFARHEGRMLVWDIVVDQNGAVTVNGVPLSGIPGMAPQPDNR